MTPLMLATQRGYDNVVHLVLEDENLMVEGDSCKYCLGPILAFPPSFESANLG
jgi:hypothetical protein